MKKRVFAIIGGTLLAALAAILAFANSHPAQVDATGNVTIDATPEDIWEYASDFEGEFERSNPDHDGLEITSSPKTPFRDGLRFRQYEYVGGFRATLDGIVFDVYRPERFRWRAETTYSVGGWQFITIEEGGTFRIEPTREGDGQRVTHRVYGIFPDTFWGRSLSWIATALLNMQHDAVVHTQTELEYFKSEIEKR